jgi:hypothetical protein
MLFFNYYFLQTYLTLQIIASNVNKLFTNIDHFKELQPQAKVE